MLAWRVNMLQTGWCRWREATIACVRDRSFQLREEELHGGIELVRREVLTLEGSLQHSRSLLAAAKSAQTIAEQAADMEKAKAEARFAELKQEKVIN